MNSTATQIANLSAEKRALLSKLLKNKGKVNADAIPRRHRENGLPLSFAQERMWFLAQLDPENPNYNVAGAIRISGELNISLLEQCVNEVVRRHEVLRTAFGIANGQTEQVVLDTISVPLSLVDLSCLPLHDLDAEQDKLIKRELQKPFVLTADEPLLRMTLLLIKPQEFMLLLSMHHIVSDEWSLRLLISEIGQLYQALMKGEPSLLPELAIQYADYASWQRSKLVGEARDKQLGYWLNFLGGVPQVLTLPSDRPRPPIRTNRGAVYSMALPKALSDGIMRLSRALDMTLFMTLMGAFSLLLHRYTSMDDLCIGYPATNRNKPELEKLIGFFVNTLVLRTQVAGNPRLADFLAEVRRNLLDAKKHQDFPFEQLVEELHPERNLGHHPLFQVMFNYQSSSMDLPEIPGLNFQLLEAGSTTAKFDLTLLATKTDDSIVCTFEYSTELFEEKTIARMAGHFETLLAGMVSQPDSRISELPLLTQLERKQVLVDWNATTADYPAGQSLHALFEAQVKKTPDALAVMFERQSLSYAELNSKANRLAHYLCDQGVGPDVLVGVCLERSLEMVIGLLGILKAGGAYVPLDPGYPQDRLDFMLHDVGAPIVLTQEACRGKLAASAAAVLCLDSEWGVVEGASDANPGIPLMPENLAYCIYTSGSTGQPKGAGVPHQGIVNRLQWMQAQYSLDQSDRILQKTPYSFDVSVWEFFWPLMTGAKLIVARPDEHKDSLALIDTIVDRQVTTIHFVPSMLQAFIDTPGVENCTSLKRIVCSGEALPADLAVRFRQKIQAELHNLYGPTEASVDVSYWACLPDSAETAIPIGRPIANIELYILDRQLNPVPAGIPGELHIGGIGLGRGYLNRPGLTAEKFIPNPYDTSGSRLYKTGDLVRYRPDGNIDYLGRIDHQVKIRGFRIELGEIEARLLDVPDIQEAVVIAREDQSGDKRLVAYLVAATTDAVDIETLKSRLRQILPDYMVPSAFVVLESMPLSANGKLDRKRLPQPDMSGMSANRYVAPRTATEHILAGIWADVLGIEKVGVEDDFFELGGHSLLAAQMSFAVQKEFNLKLSLRMFLETPTIAAQARLIELGESDEASVDIESDAVLDPVIIPLASPPIDVSAAQAMFLTGATGFLGIFLLADLLQQTEAKIYCLIRAVDEREALLRLQCQITRYELEDRVDLTRVIAVCGDLSEPGLGLSEMRYREIAGRVEVIYHNGALVNFVLPYKALKAANVLGTEEVLRLACCGKAKAVHYVSTVSVFSEASAAYKENDEPKLSDNLNNGYAQSKWVAERVVSIARDRGFQVTVYRPATVAGASDSGAWNTEDYLCRLIKGCIQMGYAPAERVRMNMAPVDYMSRAIVSLSLQPGSIGSYFHLNHPAPPYSGQLIDGFSQAGYRLDRIPYRNWVKKVLEAGEANRKDFALLPLLSMFSDQDRDDEAELSEEDAISYDCSETHGVLSKLGIECALVDDELLTRYQAYFKRSGFVLEPEHY